MRRTGNVGNPPATNQPLVQPGRAQIRVAENAQPSLLDDERGKRVVLPADYPEWHRDSLSLSNRARTLFAKLRPFMIRVFSFWDHRTTSVDLDDLIVDVDASGSYSVR